MSPSREFLIRGGYVMPVDPLMADLPSGDVHIKDGIIVAVDEHVDAPSAEVIDARHSVVMPGFVDTHWHMWSGIWKGLAAGPSDYFRLLSLGQHYTIDDHYTAVQMSALEAVNAGITTCHNWAHGVRGYDDVEAEMQALVDAGLRAKMGYPSITMGQSTSREDLQRALDWIAAHGEGRIGLGMLLDEMGKDTAQSTVLGRELGLRPITNHGGFLATPDIIGPEFMFTHGAGMDGKLAGALASMKLHIACCPGTDPMIGCGMPPVYTCLEAGLPLENIGFSVDVTCQAPADPFASLRTMVNAARMQQVADRGLTGNLLGIVKENIDWKYTYRDAITTGTLSGANILGLADVTGSLTPGKRADLIVVRTDRTNMVPAEQLDQAVHIVQQAEVENIDTVFIDGVMRKSGGRLVGVDISAVLAKAAKAQADIRQRAGSATLAN